MTSRDEEYQSGYASGYADGVRAGRKAMLEELRADLGIVGEGVGSEGTQKIRAALEAMRHRRDN